MGYDVYLGDILFSGIAICVGGFLVSKGYKLILRLLSVMAILLILSVFILFIGVVSHTGLEPLFNPPFAYGTEGSGVFQILTVAVISPWLFVGFETVSQFRSITKKDFPLRRIFFGAGAAIGAGALIYCALVLIGNAGVPEGYRTWQDYVILSAGREGEFNDIPTLISVERYMGQAGFVIMGIAFFCALFSSVLGLIMISSRTLRLMAMEELAPLPLAKLNKAGIPKNAIMTVVIVSVVVLFAGLNFINHAVNIATLSISIVYGYVSVGAVRKAKSKSYMVSGLIGAILAVLIFGLLITPNSVVASQLVTEDYFILSAWSLAGLIYYRFILTLDKKGSLGKSMLMWILLFFMLFYSTNMWTNDRMESELLNVSDTKDISSILRTNSLISMIVVVLAVIILFELFYIMMNREKKLEESIRAAMEKDEVKNSLLSNMSHDIRTPLNAIIGFTDLGLVNKDSKKKMISYLEKIRFSGVHLRSLVDDVLDMNRIEGGNLELNEETVNLPRQMNRLMTVVFSRADAKKHNLRLDINPIYDENVICDMGCLYRLILNITDWVIMHTHDGGSIEVGVHQLAPAEEGLAIYEFFVKTSENFDENEIFSPGTDNESIGMAVAVSIVKLMDGQIETDPAPEMGTEIYVTFEFRTSDTNEERDESQRSVDLFGKRALVVDDIMVNRQIAAAILNVFGMEVEEACDGDEAVERIQSSLPGHFDVVLMDIKMQKMDGDEATKAIRSLPDPVNSGVPVIAMTANVLGEDRQKAFEAGIDEYIEKPIDRALLQKTLSDIFRDKEEA